MILCFTSPRTPAKTGALGKGLIRMILSYSFSCPRTPAKTEPLGTGLMSYPIPLYLPEYPCKNLNSRQRAYTNDPIISFLFLFTNVPEYPCKNWGSRQGVYTHDSILNIPDKITVVPSTHTSPKLQLRRATLHNWPAGAPQCIVQPVLNVTEKNYSIKAHIP